MNEGCLPNVDEPPAGSSPTADDLRRIAIEARMSQMFGRDSSARMYGAKAKSATKPMAELLGDVAKIAGIATGFCSVLGALLITGYLLSADVPLPAQIGDITTLALPTLVIAAFLVAFLSALFGAPLFVRRLHRAYLSSVIGKPFLEKLRAHLWCYSAWLITSAAFLVFLVATIKGLAQLNVLWGWALCIGAYVVIFLVVCYEKSFSMPSPLRVLVSWLVLLWSFLLIFALQFGVMSVIPAVSDWAYVVASALIATVMSLMLWQPDKQAPRWVVLAFICFVVVVGWPFNWGGLALRVLGIGGNLPVSISVKETPYGASAALTRRVTGCLAFAISADIFIRTGTSRLDCHARNLWPLAPGSNSTTLAYHQLVRYARGDVSMISEYPEIFWVDAGTRGQLGLAERPPVTAVAPVTKYRKEHGFSKTYSVLANDDTCKDNGTVDPVVKVTIPVRGIPSEGCRAMFLKQLAQLTDDLRKGTGVIIEGDRVWGQTSFLAVSVLVANGAKPDEADENVSALIGRPALETDEQKEFTNEVAQKFPLCVF